MKEETSKPNFNVSDQQRQIIANLLNEFTYEHTMGRMYNCFVKLHVMRIQIPIRTFPEKKLNEIIDLEKRIIAVSSKRVKLIEWWQCKSNENLDDLNKDKAKRNYLVEKAEKVLVEKYATVIIQTLQDFGYITKEREDNNDPEVSQHGR